MRAFSLIELMVVIVIVAILATVALPVYKTYTVKAKINTSFNAVAAYAAKIREYYELKLEEIDTAYLYEVSVPLGITTDESFHWIFTPPYDNNGAELPASLNINRLYYEGHADATNPYFLFVVFPTNTGDATIDAGQVYVYGCRLKNETWECACGRRWNSNNPGLDLSYLPNICSKYSDPISSSGFLD